MTAGEDLDENRVFVSDFLSKSAKGDVLLGSTHELSTQHCEWVHDRAALPRFYKFLQWQDRLAVTANVILIAGLSQSGVNFYGEQVIRLHCVKGDTIQVPKTKVYALTANQFSQLCQTS